MSPALEGDALPPDHRDVSHRRGADVCKAGIHEHGYHGDSTHYGQR